MRKILIPPRLFLFQSLEGKKNRKTRSKIFLDQILVKFTLKKISENILRIFQGENKIWEDGVEGGGGEDNFSTYETSHRIKAEIKLMSQLTFTLKS
jgi:hypothetical protein